MGSEQAQAVTRLSERQRQCLALIAAGSSPKEVATELDLSVQTVHAHLKAARRTLGVGSSRQAARIASESVGNHQMVMGAAVDDDHPPGHGMAGSLTGNGDGELRDIHPAGTMGTRDIRRSVAGRLDHLTPLRRALLLVLATVGTVVAVAGLVATAHGLQQMLWSMYDMH